MAQTVSFKDTADNILPAEEFISKASAIFQAPLRKAVDTLSKKGTLGFDPRAQKWPNGHWTYVIDSEVGYPTTFTFFLDEEVLAISKVPSPTYDAAAIRQRRLELGHLTIQDPQGPRDSIGGYHPGWWDVERYVTFQSQIDPQSGEYLLALIPELRKGVDTEDYTYKSDGTIHIHIDKMISGKKITIDCIASFN